MIVFNTRQRRGESIYLIRSCKLITIQYTAVKLIRIRKFGVVKFPGILYLQRSDAENFFEGEFHHVMYFLCL